MKSEQENIQYQQLVIVDILEEEKVEEKSPKPTNLNPPFPHKLKEKGQVEKNTIFNELVNLNIQIPLPHDIKDSPICNKFIR